MPNYTLKYFNARSRAEPARLIFAAAGIDFVDDRIELAEWTAERKAETPIGQLPYLQVDGAKIPGSITIARFLAREFNLAGEGNLEQVRGDNVCSC